MITVTENKRDSFNLEILVNGELYRLVSCSMFQSRLSLPKDFSSLEEVQEWFLQEEYRIGKNYLLYLLGRQDYLSSVLRRKFKEKKFSQPNYERLIEEFTELGYIQDENLIVRLIRAEMGKDKGPIATRLKLLSKGCDATIIEKHLQKCMTNDYQKEKIEKLALKLQSKGLEKHIVMQKLYRLGFEMELIKASI